jgi:hypothetical protein
LVTESASLFLNFIEVNIKIVILLVIRDVNGPVQTDGTAVQS